MTPNEQYEIAWKYINGIDGLKKNEKKGWELMKEAADAGEKTARYVYGKHITATDPVTAVGYMAGIDYHNDGETDYLQAMSLAAAQQPNKAEEYLQAALKYEEVLSGDGLCYLARIYKRARSNDGEGYKKKLNAAALNGCQILTDAELTACGRERGVLNGRAEVENWLKTAKFQDVYFSSLSKNEGMAKALVDAHLDEKEAKRLLGGTVKKLKSMKPQTTLEYQMIFTPHALVDEISYTFRHQETNSVTYNTGSGTVPVCEGTDKSYAGDIRGLGPAFKVKKEYQDLSYYDLASGVTDEVPDARVRVNFERYDEIKDAAYKRMSHKATETYERVARLTLSDKYNWTPYNIEIDSSRTDWQMKLEATFVPFWFFTYKLEKQTVTARVNASTGEVNFFIDNPFGLLGKDDNLEKGGFWQIYDNTKIKWGIVIGLTIIPPFCFGLLYLLGVLWNKVTKKLTKKK